MDTSDAAMHQPHAHNLRGVNAIFNLKYLRDKALSKMFCSPEYSYVIYSERHKVGQKFFMFLKRKTDSLADDPSMFFRITSACACTVVSVTLPVVCKNQTLARNEGECY